MIDEHASDVHPKDIANDSRLLYHPSTDLQHQTPDTMNLKQIVLTSALTLVSTCVLAPMAVGMVNPLMPAM